MNDPNGLIFWNGLYHMFYQCNPASTAHTDVCWGHTASKDLVHWEDLPLALVPTPGSPDEAGCWSGCAIVHDGSVYLLYTGVQGKPPNHLQRPCLARAIDDDLVSFEKFAGNPVISEEPIDGLIGFRDHTVRRAAGEFRQLIGSGSAALGGCVLEYRSTDLISWDYCGLFLDAKSSDLPGTMWECPDLFQLGDRWYLVTSIFDNEPGHVIAVEGHFENQRFVPTASTRLDLGGRWYTPQSFDAPDGRRISFGWLREREDELPLATRDRIGVMSLPRQLLVGHDGSLAMAPAEELVRLRKTPLKPVQPTGPPAGLVLEANRPLSAFEVEVSSDEVGAVLVDLLDDDDHLVVQVGAHGADIDISASTDRSRTVSEPGPGQLRIFYDDGICEVFTSVGKVRTEIFYDVAPVRRAVVHEVRPQGNGGGPSTLRASAWELARIWDAERPDG